MVDFYKLCKSSSNLCTVSELGAPTYAQVTWATLSVLHFDMELKVWLHSRLYLMCLLIRTSWFAFSSIHISCFTLLTVLRW